MVSNVPSGLFHRIAASRPAPKMSQSGHPAVQVVHVFGAGVQAEEVQEFVNRAALQGQAAIHIGLAHIEPGIDCECVGQGAIVKPNGDGRPGGGISEPGGPAGGVDDSAAFRARPPRGTASPQAFNRHFASTSLKVLRP